MEIDSNKSVSLKNPPIVEALAQINFDNIQDPAFIRNALDSFKPEKFEEILEIQVGALNEGVDKAVISGKIVGYRMFLGSGTVVLQVAPNYLTVSYLGKYSDWSHFESIFMGYFNQGIKIGTIVNISKVTLRYVNSFAVPNNVGLSDHFRVRPDFVDQTFISPSKMSCTIETDIMGGNGIGLINQHIESRASEGKWNVMLDLETSIVRNIKTDPSEILKQFSKLRDEKNKLFDAVITKRTYELFSE